MLIILNKEHFNQVMELAAKEGLAHQLLEQLHYLHTYSDNGHGDQARCLLAPDGDAKQMSFGFRVQRLRVENGWRKGAPFSDSSPFGFNARVDTVIIGGLIYNPNALETEDHWSVHT